MVVGIDKPRQQDMLRCIKGCAYRLLGFASGRHFFDNSRTRYHNTASGVGVGACQRISDPKSGACLGHACRLFKGEM
jgi:hypothetical protein